MTAGRYHAAVRALEEMVDRLLSPAQRMARDLGPWSAYVVLPVFAFANAGIELHFNIAEFLTPVSLGIILGLVVGKPLGLSLGAWLATRAGIATKPDDITWPQLIGAGMLCGIGFTMAFFVAEQTFEDASTLTLVKLCVLTASVLAAAAGVGTLRLLDVKRKAKVCEATRR